MTVPGLNVPVEKAVALLKAILSDGEQLALNFAAGPHNPQIALKHDIRVGDWERATVDRINSLFAQQVIRLGDLCKGGGRLDLGKVRDLLSSIETTKPGSPAPARTLASQPGLQPDPRRVFVVHGRNRRARDAMFAFLRSINLDPIEWSEAVSFTGDGAPYIGQVLDVAFSSAKAVVVLITGDDVARLGTRFLDRNDPPYERDLTPQARPNVLFEAGMAFGRHPERTIIVSLGIYRPFSDVAGRAEVRISDRIEDRQALIVRLRTAGCEVKAESRTEWISAGDFDPAVHPPDMDQALNNGTRDSRPDAPTPAPPDGVIEGGGLQLRSDGLNVALRIWPHESLGNRGLVYTLINHRQSDLIECRVKISKAQSYDLGNSGYRDMRRDFKPVVLRTFQYIDAGDETKADWLAIIGDGFLSLGSGHSGGLDWPRADSSDKRTWRLEMSVEARGLNPWEFAVRIDWLTGDNSLSISLAQ